MPESIVEIDFFQMEKANNGFTKPPSSERVASSCRRIQNVVSKINPELLKTVMAAGAAPQARCRDGVGLGVKEYPFQSSNLHSSSRGSDTKGVMLSSLPVLDSSSRAAVHGHPPMAPLTIFYNGTVTAFDVSGDKAEAIIRMAESGMVENPVERPGETPLDGHQVEGDLPIARRKSLQRFLEKRKERYTAPAEPFSSPSLSLMAVYQIEHDSAECVRSSH